MHKLLSAQQMQNADNYTQETIGLPSIVLMERAALAVADRVRDVVCIKPVGRRARIAIVAGKGNNGADALAVGRILIDRGYAVDCYVCDDAPAEGTNLYTQEQILRKYGVALQNLSTSLDSLTQFYDLYIDGLFGIGLTREVSGTYAEIIEAINEAAEHHHSRILAVDIPSGIDATDGHVCGTAIRATHTVTFGFYKRGQFLYPGTTYCGHLWLADIGIPSSSHPGAAWYTYDQERVGDLLPPRAADGNKGTNGKGLIVAGTYSMAGAAVLAADAAGRMGCGMVKVYTREENRVILQDSLPACLLSVWSPEDLPGATERLISDLAWADTVAVGPGLGKGDAEHALVRTILQHAADVRHLILDADAIRIIAENNEYDLLAEAGRQTDVILTPHLAECAALLQTTVDALRANREEALHQFADVHHVTILCKDARSMAVQAGHEEVYLNTSGNDGLATAGTGDVLTGMLTGCAAQGLSGLAAASAASYLHGRRAESAERKRDRRELVATDLFLDAPGSNPVAGLDEFRVDPWRPDLW